MGIAEFIIDILSDDYLVWDSGVITCKDKLYPVIRIKDITDSMGRSCIRLEYYSDLSASEDNLLKEDTIPVGDNIDVIVKDISDRMESFEWYDKPDNYISEHTFSLDLPCSLILQLNERYGLHIRKGFAVYADEGEVSYTAPDGEQIRSDIRFDIAIPVNKLDTGRWYELRFRALNPKAKHSLTEQKNSGDAIILSGACGDIIFAVSAFNPVRYAKERSEYEVKPTRRGFAFRIFNDTIKQIWFKAAWIQKGKYSKEIYEEALCSWIS